MRLRIVALIATLACLSLSTGCGKRSVAALQSSEQVIAVPGGWRVNLAGLEEMKKDCGFLATPADDPLQLTESPAEVIVTDGYMTKLMLACAR